VPTPTAPPEPTAVITTEFPKTGGDFTPWIGAGAALILIAGLAYVAWRFRRAIVRR
jgi:LPXTG-motif cell wall-anchored protein